MACLGPSNRGTAIVSHRAPNYQLSTGPFEGPLGWWFSQVLPPGQFRQDSLVAKRVAHTEVSIETAPLDTSATGNDIRGGDEVWMMMHDDDDDDDDGDDVFFFWGGEGEVCPPKKPEGFFSKCLKRERCFYIFCWSFGVEDLVQKRWARC